MEVIVEEKDEQSSPMHTFRGSKPGKANIIGSCTDVHKMIHNLVVEMNFRDDAAHNLAVAQQIMVLSQALVNLEGIRRTKVSD